MTGRTHDLTAFTALNLAFLYLPLTPMSLATAVVSLGAGLLGGLAPDLDQSTATLWYRLPAGSIIGRLISPILGSHRMISHSLLGVYLAGWLMKVFLNGISNILLVDMNIVWASFMIGLLSHLLVDMLSREGVPWLFPIPLNIGFPPFRFMRLKTGGIMEKSFIFPGLMLLNGYLIYENYGKYLEFIKGYLK
jgi:inner membrane protein